jgi:hypothetical protein
VRVFQGLVGRAAIRGRDVLAFLPEHEGLQALPVEIGARFLVGLEVEDVAGDEREETPSR